MKKNRALERYEYVKSQCIKTGTSIAVILDGLWEYPEFREYIRKDPIFSEYFNRPIKTNKNSSIKEKKDTEMVDNPIESDFSKWLNEFNAKNSLENFLKELNGN